MQISFGLLATCHANHALLFALGEVDCEGVFVKIETFHTLAVMPLDGPYKQKHKVANAQRNTNATKYDNRQNFLHNAPRQEFSTRVGTKIVAFCAY